jgi:hypothetical protein
MTELNLRVLIEDAVARFNEKRIGARPTVSATISPELSNVCVGDGRLGPFIGHLLYDVLVGSHPGTSLQVFARRRFALDDLQRFVGLEPLYWVQLGIAGRGAHISQDLIEERFARADYACGEWIVVEGTTALLAVFSSMKKDALKVVFCIDTAQAVKRCDLLIPCPPAAASEEIVQRP